MNRDRSSLPVRLFRRAISALAQNAQNVLTALVQIAANKGRSFLTTLGIIIAVTATITVISFVRGFGDFLTGMVRGYGTQFMIVHPYVPPERARAGMASVVLDLNDIEAVRQECPSVRRITPFVYTSNANVAYGVEMAEDVPVRGVTEDYQVIRNFFVDAGRFFGPVDVENSENVVVLGRSVLKLLGADDSILSNYVLIDDARFLVVGLLTSKGSMMGEDQDKTVMIPYTTAINLYPQLRRQVPFLAEAVTEDAIPQAAAQITNVLRRRHRLQPGQPDDFRLNRQDQALREFEKIRNIASGALAGIVAISLVVGGIGIMNMMLVSVTERTREIGLRKSIGARRRDILFQFLTEAVVLCSVGGMIGVAAGYAITSVAALHPNMVNVSVPMWSVVLALCFSAGTGVFFGLVPALKASLLHPIDALRHE
jgi:putative ABC transport system permease protein